MNKDERFLNSLTDDEKCDTVLKLGCTIASVLGDEGAELVEELKGQETDYSVDGVIDYLCVSVQLLWNHNNKQALKYLHMLNKLERAINWKAGKPYKTNGVYEPYFKAGNTTHTREVNACTLNNEGFKNEVIAALQSHLLKDYGEVSAEGVEANNATLNSDNIYVLSRYTTSERDIYIITEGSEQDRRTLILFCDEY